MDYIVDITNPNVQYAMKILAIPKEELQLK